MAKQQVYKIFCDESCHLEHDGADVMVLGALYCSAEKSVKLSKHIKWLRYKYNYHNELKWTKLIAKQWPFYQALLDLLINNKDLCFKATVVQCKQMLKHDQYNAGSHNTFYYKMFYYTLRNFLEVGNTYRIYMDYMDTLGAERTKMLCEVLQSETHGKLDVNVYIVHSHEAQLIQLCDILIGAIAYKNRSDIKKNSQIKNKIIRYLEDNLGHELNYGTPPWEQNFNIFLFAPRNV